MTTPAVPTRSRHVVTAVFAGILATLLLAAGGAVWLSSGEQRVVHAAAVQPVPDPALLAALPSGPQTAAPWDKPLMLSVVDGTLKSVTVLNPDGAALPGTVVDRTAWQSTEQSLLPAATYRVTATVLDNAGQPRAMNLAVRTTPATRLLRAVLSPGDGRVVGVGMPVIMTLSRPVTTAADRAAVVSRLTVQATPAVAGAWRWMSDRELHYRGPSYWKAGSTIAVRAQLTRLALSDGTWGSGSPDTRFRIGDAVISTVDVTGFRMAVRKNGKLLRVLKVSTGREKYPSRGGVHIVLEKVRVKLMDSATVGIPRNSPDGYYEKVPFSVRISYGGAFVHSAGWSVRDQGIRNVSHGCVNMSPADAQWFYGLAKRGDVVTVINSKVKPLLSDPGTSDWNVPFAEWAN